jgi:hypothetical protein
MESEKSFTVKPENTPETIISAALQFEDGKVFTGYVHADALIAAGEAYEVRNLDKLPGFIEGFTTSTGRFVERQEAGAIAKASQQLEHLDTRRVQHAEKNLDSYDILELRQEDNSNWYSNLFGSDIPE